MIESGDAARLERLRELVASQKISDREPTDEFLLRQLDESQAEVTRLAQERDKYKAWCDAETAHIAAVRRERDEAVAALAAVQPLIEAASTALAEHNRFGHIGPTTVRQLEAALSSFPATPAETTNHDSESLTDPHFILRFMDDDELLHELELDEPQVTLYPDRSRIVISLSGAQLAEVRNHAALRNRIILGEGVAQLSVSTPERHCPDHPLNTTSDGDGTLFCATFGCSWRSLAPKPLEE